MKSKEKQLGIIERQVSEQDPRYEHFRDSSKELVSENVSFSSEALIEYIESVDRARAQRKRAEELRNLSETLSRDSVPKHNEILAEASRAEVEAQKEFDGRADHLRGVFEILASSMLSANFSYLSRERKNFLCDEIMAMISGLEMLAEIKRYFGDDFSEFSIQGLLEKILTRSFSEEFLYEAALHHENAMDLRKESLDVLAKASKEKFRTAIERAIVSGILTSGARDTLPRIEKVIVGLRDRLSSPFSGIGAFAHKSGYVGIYSDLLMKEKTPQAEHALFHEYFHELSGQSITVSSQESKDSDFRAGEVSWFQRKSGLQLLNPEARVLCLGTWINEAVTEWLALELSGYLGDADNPHSYKGSLFYVEERKELDRLFAAGLDKDLTQRAYFENFVSDQPKGEKGRYFSEFVKQVNAIEGEFGFSKLQNKYLLRGVVVLLIDASIILHPAKSIDLKKLSPDIPVVDVCLEMGIDERSSVAEHFVHLFRQSPGMARLSLEEQYEKLESVLQLLQKKYGRRFQYVLSSVDNHSSVDLT